MFFPEHSVLCTSDGHAATSLLLKVKGIEITFSLLV